VRNGERLSVGEYGKTSVVKRDAFDPQRALETDQILVAAMRRGAPIMRAYASGVALMIRCAFRRQARLSAQQPRKGLFKWRLMECRRAADDAAADF